MKSPPSSKAKRSARADRLSLRLYVAGQLPGSVDAQAILRALCAADDSNPPELEIVDLLQEPDRALTDGIMVTPTLVRVAPKPEVRILGLLSDSARIRSALGLGPQAKDRHD